MNCSASGLRVETNLHADAVVQVGAGHWQHVPLGDLHDDRYLPLHPQLVELIGECRTRHVHPDNHLLLPRENGEHDSSSTRTIQCERFEIRRRAGITWLRPAVPRCRIDMP